MNSFKELMTKCKAQLEFVMFYAVGLSLPTLGMTTIEFRNKGFTKAEPQQIQGRYKRNVNCVNSQRKQFLFLHVVSSS